jgi:hypothetical protein
MSLLESFKLLTALFTYILESISSDMDMSSRYHVMLLLLFSY